MEIHKLKKERTGDENRSVAIGVRTSKEKSEWMKAKEVSPTKVFNQALDELIVENPLSTE